MYLHKYSPLWRWFGLINLSHDSSSLVVLTHITFVDRRRTSQTLCRKTFAKTMGTTSDEWHQGVRSNSTMCIVNKNNVLSSRRTGAFKPFRVLYGLETHPFINIVFASCYVFWNIKLILLQYTYLVKIYGGKNESNENFKTTIPSNNYDRPKTTGEREMF